MSVYSDFYRQKIEEGELWMQYCPQCLKYVFYPRSLCPDCLQAGLEWRKMSGKGIIYSYTIVNVSALPEFSQDVPYIYAVVELEEGVRMASNIVDYKAAELRVELPVELTVIDRGGRNLPVFKPFTQKCNDTK